MAEIDKNPRQITRLRIEDQAKLEKLASVTRFDEGDNTPRFTVLYVDGTAAANNFYVYETIDFTGGTIKYNSNDAGVEFYNSETEFTAHLHQVAANEEILTDKSVKTVLGQSIYSTDGGNIDLYVHYLKITAVNDLIFYGFCYSSIKTSASGVGQGLTTLFKAPANQARNYITLGDIEQNGGSALLQWTGTIWQVTYNGSQFNVTNVVDRVEPI